MTELEQNIKTYFGVIQQDDLHAISSFFHLETIKKEGYFLKAGKRCDKLSFIQSGLFRTFAAAGDKEVTQWIATQGYFLTDVSGWLFETHVRWSIQALTDSVLYTINKEDYKRLGSLIPRWHELEKLFIAKCFILLEDRIFSQLSMSAEERYQLFFENNKELFNQVPLQYIASMLGMTPETFSRIRQRKPI